MNRLQKFDVIMGAWAEAPSGPGWKNQLIWVVIYNSATGQHRVEALQPDKQTMEMLSLFKVCLAASKELIRAVKNRYHEVKS